MSPITNSVLLENNAPMSYANLSDMLAERGILVKREIQTSMHPMLTQLLV